MPSMHKWIGPGCALLALMLIGCGNRVQPAEVIDAWATAAADQDWSRARELMAADDQTFGAWRLRHAAIAADLQPPHQVLEMGQNGDTASAVVRWPARTGGWCAPVYVDEVGRLTLPRSDLYYACDAQAQALTPPAAGEVQPRVVQQETHLFPNAIEINPIATVQAGERVVVVMETYYSNRYWYKVRPAPGSTATWTEGYILAEAVGGKH